LNDAGVIDSVTLSAHRGPLRCLVKYARTPTHATRDAQVPVRVLQVGHARDDLEVGGREAARVGHARLENHTEEAFEIRRFVGARTEALQRPRDRRHLVRQVRAPEIQFEEAHGLRAVGAEGGSREDAQRRVVLVDGGDQQVVARAGAGCTSIHSNR
jgi:hypothetical protein